MLKMLAWKPQRPKWVDHPVCARTPPERLFTVPTASAAQSKLASHTPLNSRRAAPWHHCTPERVHVSYSSRGYYLPWFMPVSAATAEVNRNASLFADLRSEIFIPRISLAEIGVARIGGIRTHALCKRSSAAFSHAGSHTSSAWTWPSQGRQESPTYLTAAVKLLSCFYSRRHFIKQATHQQYHFDEECFFCCGSLLISGDSKMLLSQKKK